MLKRYQNLSKGCNRKERRTTEKYITDDRRMTNIFERYLTLWAGLCIVGGIVLGKVAPNRAKTLDGMDLWADSYWA